MDDDPFHVPLDQAVEPTLNIHGAGELPLSHRCTDIGRRRISRPFPSG
jgi:hypothetical protein